MKKIRNIFVVLALIGIVCLCSGCSTQKNDEKSLYAQGIEIVSLMKEMVENEDYLDIYTENEAILQHLSGAGPADPTKPKAVYEISVPEDELMQLFQLEKNTDFSDSLKSFLKARTYSAFASELNAMGGAELLAASSICTTVKNFISTDFTGNVLYLYLYENSAPVLISFSSNSENIVTATGNFILCEAFNSRTKEDIEAFFEYISVDVKEVLP